MASTHSEIADIKLSLTLPESECIPDFPSNDSFQVSSTKSIISSILTDDHEDKEEAQPNDHNDKSNINNFKSNKANLSDMDTNDTNNTNKKPHINNLQCKCDNNNMNDSNNTNEKPKPKSVPINKSNVMKPNISYATKHRYQQVIKEFILKMAKEEYVFKEVRSPIYRAMTPNSYQLDIDNYINTQFRFRLNDLKN